MRVLLTAFEPFDETGLNASLEGCRRFLERWGGEFDVRFAVLPVEYGPDTEAAERALAEGPVDVLLHTGQAGRAAVIRVERIAVNVRYAASVSPNAVEQQVIAPEGPLALASPLPVDDVAAAIRGKDIPAVVSNHAGIYLCNHVLYHSLWRAERERSGAQAGFLHVPRLPEQVAPGEPSLTAEEIGRAVRVTLRHLASRANAAKL
jgi:pyroglutamyl-peptidase